MRREAWGRARRLAPIDRNRESTGFCRGVIGSSDEREWRLQRIHLRETSGGRSY